jgi:histidinol-phosphate aminotransferase
LNEFPNLVVLQTFSKAWGSAAIRLGMAYASEEIIQVLNKIKYPYNINILTQNQALKALQNNQQVKEWVELLLGERAKLVQELKKIEFVKHIYASDANFVLIRVDDANGIYQYLVEKSIIVRNRNTVSLCLGCIRITVGTPEENSILLQQLKQFGK